MVKQKRKRSSKTLRHFYLNDELHKTLNVFRSEDMLIAWNYPQHKRVAYVLSDCRRNMQRAYIVDNSMPLACHLVEGHSEFYATHHLGKNA